MSRNYLSKRKDFILGATFDIITFYIINDLYNTNYHYLQIFIWALISYVIGRYHYKYIGKYNYIISSIFLFLITTIFFAIFIFLLNYFSKILLFDLNLFSPNFLFYGFISISFINFLNLYVSKYKKRNYFFFIGSDYSFEEFCKFVNFTNNDHKIFCLKSLEELLSPKLSKNNTIVIYDEYFLTKGELNNLYENHRNILFLEIAQFQEQFLYRIKPELLSRYLNIKSKNQNYFMIFLQLRIKRLFDILGSLILILITSSIIIISSLMIIFEDGMPILFTQKRTGKNLNLFDIYKLRTMKKNSEKNGPQWSNANDSRITKVGKFIRLARIDELPQLFLVLKGKMSLIGPRPERPEIDKKIIKDIPNFDYRYKVKPGISGWAQVNYPYGASIKDAYNKLSYDLYYITNFSILLDLIIFFKTLKIVFTLKGAIAKT